jgi:hypothetical protein
LKEVVCPVLEFREEKRTFAKFKGGKVDFFREGTIWKGPFSLSTYFGPLEKKKIQPYLAH